VQLQLDNIWLCKTKDDVQATLRDLPTDLNTLYARCFKKITPDTGLKSLRWIYSAPRPFKIAELCEFLAIDPQTGLLQREAIIDKSVVIEGCSNLIYINVNDEVVFVHHSLRRFLQTIEGSLIWNLKQEKLNLGCLCLKYLTGPDFTLAVDHRREKVSIPYDGRTLVQQVFDLPRILQPRSTRPARAVTVSPQALGMVRNQARGPLHALVFARQSWLLLTRHITVHEPHWKLFLELALRPSDEFKFHPWECQAQSMQAHYGKLLGWSIAYSHWPLLLTLSYATSPRPRGEIYDIPLPEYHGLLPLHLAARTQNKAVASNSTSYVDRFAHEYIFEDIFRHAKYLSDKQKYTALHHAAEVGNTSAVKLIVDLKPPQFRQDQDDHKRTALAVAAIEGKHKVLSILLQFGADCKMAYLSEDRSEPLERPLMGAVKNGHLLAVKTLLREGKTSHTTAVDSKSRTALHYAAEFPTKQSRAIVELLLKHGSCYDEKALKTACSNGNVAAAEKLIGLVCSTWNAGTEAEVPGLDISHQTMLDFIDTAIRNREDTVVRTFINAGGYDGNRDPLLQKGQLSRLDQMPVQELQDYVQFLRDCGWDINTVDGEGCTPLMHAVRSRMGILARIMLSYEDIALHLQNAKGNTALHFAMDELTQSTSIFGDETVDRLFIQQHVSKHFDILNLRGLTPLSFALTRPNAWATSTTEKWRSILTSRGLNTAVSALSKYQFTQYREMAEIIHSVVANLNSFSTIIPITAPHMAFTINVRSKDISFAELTGTIERSIRWIHSQSEYVPKAVLGKEFEPRHCKIHATSSSFHYDAGVFIKDIEVTICMVPEELYLPISEEFTSG
jgi:ankyrin repeat protein